MRSFTIIVVLLALATLVVLETGCSSRECACLPGPPHLAPALVTKPQLLTFSALGTSAAQTLVITLPTQQNIVPSETDNCAQGAIRVVNVSSPTAPQGGASTVIITPEANGSCALTFSGKPGVAPAMVSVSVAAS